MATAITRLCIGPADHGRRMTLQEFRDAEEQEGSRYERARGALEVSQGPDEPPGRRRPEPLHLGCPASSRSSTLHLPIRRRERILVRGSGGFSASWIRNLGVPSDSSTGSQPLKEAEEGSSYTLSGDELALHEG